jgi:protein TonB
MKVALRLARPRSPHSRFVLYSALAHGLLVLLVVFTPTFGGGQKITNDFIPVTLSGGLPGPPVTAPEPEAEVEPEVEPPPPEPEPEPEPEGAHLQDKIPEVDTKPKKDPPKEEKPKPRTSPRPAGDTPPASSGEATGGGGTGVPTVDLGGARFAWYGDRVGALLKGYWRPPLLDVVGDERPSVTLTFVILRDGTARNVAVDISSGVPSFDRSAMRAVLEASPFPPLPREWDDSTMPARVTFTSQN